MPTDAKLTVAADAYEALAPIYDKWQDRFGAFWKQVLPRLCDAFAQTRLPPGRASFLDLGCGTGGLLLGLRERFPDWRLCGVDGSASMLEVARRKPEADTVRWVHSSFEAPLPGGPYTAAGSFFDALNHAAEPGGLGRVCARVATALVPGGLFVFDVNNRLGFESWWSGTRTFTGPGWRLTMEADFDADQGLAHGRAIVERADAPKDQTITEVTERCFAAEDVHAALEAAGFTVLAAEPWTVPPAQAPGKTWWVARRR